MKEGGREEGKERRREGGVEEWRKGGRVGEKQKERKRNDGLSEREETAVHIKKKVKFCIFVSLFDKSTCHTFMVCLWIPAGSTRIRNAAILTKHITIQ